MPYLPTDYVLILRNSAWACAANAEEMMERSRRLDGRRKRQTEEEAMQLIETMLHIEAAIGKITDLYQA